MVKITFLTYQIICISINIQQTKLENKISLQRIVIRLGKIKLLGAVLNILLESTM